MFSGKDLANEYKWGQSLVSATRTSSGNGSAVDMQDCGPEVAAVLDVGTVTGTTPTLDVKLQESDTSGGTYSDISGATFTQVTASNNQQTIQVANRTKRYVRAVATIAGTSPSFPCSVQIVAPKQSY